VHVLVTVNLLCQHQPSSTSALRMPLAFGCQLLLWTQLAQSEMEVVVGASSSWQTPNTKEAQSLAADVCCAEHVWRNWFPSCNHACAVLDLPSIDL